MTCLPSPISLPPRMPMREALEASRLCAEAAPAPTWLLLTDSTSASSFPNTEI
jgi:hypothetical protein